MQLPAPRVGFVGFGEVNTPREVIERKCQAARHALEACGAEVVWTDPVNDAPDGLQVQRARRELAGQGLDCVVACVAGWIPSQPVVDVLSDLAHYPVVLWGLSGWMEGSRYVTTADQAGTSALREPLAALGFRLRYVYQFADKPPYSSAQNVAAYARAACAARLLRHARVGMVGYRDMNLYGTLVDQLSLRRRIGPEVESFDLLEVMQRVEALEEGEVQALVAELGREWQFEEPVTAQTLDKGVRLYLAIMGKVAERGYQAVSVVDVYGVKKLLAFPPAMVLQLLADKGGVAAIPENDALGAVTQLIVRYLTGQVGAYFEFYDYLSDRLLVGVPDFVPAEVTDGGVRVLPWPQFGGFKEGVLNVSRVRTGRVTLCRLGSRGDRYWMHAVTGQAVAPRDWAECGWAEPPPHLPSLEVILDSSVDDFAQAVLSEHYILAYGDIRPQLKELCQLLGLDVEG
jgi:L-fucose isomerase-like protein